MDNPNADVVAEQEPRELPPELWDFILEIVKEPKDIYNCSKVDPMWKRFLQDKLPTILFQLAIPNLLAYLTKKDLLACCQVSHRWNNAVDLTVNNHVESNITKQSVLFQIQPNFRSTFPNLETITRFFDNVAPPQTGSNKPVLLLPYRDIVFEFKARNLAPEHFRYLEKAFLFVINYGALVKQLSIAFDYSWATYYEAVAIVYTILLHTPNLCSLQISFYKPHQFLELDQNYVDSFFLEKNLPPLAQLKTLKLKPCSGRLARVFLQTYKSQICQFEMVDVDDFCLKSDAVHPNGNLLQEQSICTHVCSMENVLSLEQILSLHPQPIDFLTIDTCNLDIIGERLAQVVNSHRGYFRKLFLHKSSLSGKVESLQDLRGLRLPNLEILAMREFALPTLEFLTEAVPGLANLSVDVTKAELMNGGMYNNLYANHQFWAAMPTIKLVRVSLCLSAAGGDGGGNNKTSGRKGANFLRSVYNLMYKPTG